MSENRDKRFGEELLDEVCDELSHLEGEELDEFLREVGLVPGDLLEQYTMSVDAAKRAFKRARFEEARHQVRNQSRWHPMGIRKLDLRKKQQVLAAIRDRTARTHQMTVAARNQKIESEEDLDSFLEACVRLGVIDENGNLMD